MRFRTPIIRSLRKAAHIATKVTTKAAHFSGRVENKASRIISGTDSSFGAVTSVPFEKIYYQALPHITPLQPSLPQIGRKPAVTLLVPSLDNRSFFGGTATAIMAAAFLAKKKNMDLRIVQTLKFGHASVSDFLKRSGIDFKGDIKQIDVSGRTFVQYGYIDIHPDDIFMASAWWDAHLLSKLPLNKKFVYIIQDFEPIFYNNSDLYALAENSYQSDKYVALCNTQLMYDFMTNRNYKNVTAGTYFEPAVSYYQKKKAAKPAGKHRLFIYGRPNVERNLFYTALASLDYCFVHGYLDINDWEVFMAGQDQLPDMELSSRVTVKNLGKMDFEDYKKFVRTVDVAVSPMMAPHPNYPTLEFASAGAAVVTTRYDVKQDLSRYSDNIVMSDITIESMSGAIRKAAGISRAERLKNADASVATISNDWEKAFDKPLDAVIKKLK
jgi:hypothetical protein